MSIQSQSRFENAVDIPSFKRLGAPFVDQLIASLVAPPYRITLDLDADEFETPSGVGAESSSRMRTKEKTR